MRGHSALLCERLNEMRILYEDNHLLAIYKEAGMPSQADISGADDALTLSRAYIKEKYNKPGDVYMGLVHRLDRPVSGVLLLARTSKAAARLSEQFKLRETRKVYLAVVEGEAETDATLTDFLIKDERTRNTSAVSETVKGALFAELSYHRLAFRNGLSLLRVVPVTGRPHQIRVQLASRGISLYADARYGKARPNADIALHAAALTVKHPTQPRSITIAATPPEAFPWTAFREEIESEMSQYDGEIALQHT